MTKAGPAWGRAALMVVLPATAFAETLVIDNSAYQHDASLNNSGNKGQEEVSMSAGRKRGKDQD